MDSLAATAVLMCFGALGILAIGAPALAAADLSMVPPRAWGLAVFIVLFPTVGAYYLTYWALARVESSTVALFVYLQPVIAAALSAAVLGERITARVAAGAALVFLGVYVAVGHPRLRAASRAGAPEPGGTP
jgi:drug/metabolite transporter (DMT)-like permease